MDNIKELITELKQNIENCKMDIAGGNEMNVLDALDSVIEIEQLIILRVSNRRELLMAFSLYVANAKEYASIDDLIIDFDNEY
tara:strand:- start:3639 stop:3887 length:249 start_codon:yes stop_codon:yes gene_type:complete